MLFHEKIKHLRLESNYTQNILAKKLNVTRQTISSWENGRTQPSKETITLLAELYSVPIEFLLNDNKEFTDKKDSYLLTDALLNNDTLVSSRSIIEQEHPLSMLEKQIRLFLVKCVNNFVLHLLAVSLLLFPAILNPMTLLITLPFLFLCIYKEKLKLYFIILFSLFLLYATFESLGYLSLKYGWFGETEVIIENIDP